MWRVHCFQSGVRLYPLYLHRHSGRLIGLCCCFPSALPSFSAHQPDSCWAFLAQMLIFINSKFRIKSWRPSWSVVSPRTCACTPPPTLTYTHITSHLVSSYSLCVPLAMLVSCFRILGPVFISFAWNPPFITSFRSWLKYYLSGGLFKIASSPVFLVLTFIAFTTVWNS